MQINSLFKTALFGTVVILSVTVNAQIKTGSSKPNSAYQTPAFTDAERIKKIETVFPVIEKIYREYAEKNHFPGYAFGVMVDGKLAFSGSGGYTDIDKKISATTQSMFRIASMSKSFTAMAILKLREE